MSSGTPPRHHTVMAFVVDFGTAAIISTVTVSGRALVSTASVAASIASALGVPDGVAQTTVTVPVELYRDTSTRVIPAGDPSARVAVRTAFS